MNNSQYTTQNNLLLNTLLKFYNKDDNLSKILSIINGHAKESLRLIDWFVTNYAKKNSSDVPMQLVEAGWGLFGRRKFKNAESLFHLVSVFRHA